MLTATKFDRFARNIAEAGEISTSLREPLDGARITRSTVHTCSGYSRSQPDDRSGSASSPRHS